jgi:aspartate 1-decarboxylase
MLIRVCAAKIHQATVTEARLDYVGSITIDEAFLDASGIKPAQYVNITNLSNGVFWQTYVVPGRHGEGQVCLNGPPARHFLPGDKIIILAEAWIDPASLKDLNPVIVFTDFVNGRNIVRGVESLVGIINPNEASAAQLASDAASPGRG